jgi:hypothetical protein
LYILNVDFIIDQLLQPVLQSGFGRCIHGIKIAGWLQAISRIIMKTRSEWKCSGEGDDKLEVNKRQELLRIVLFQIDVEQFIFDMRLNVTKQI